MSGTERGSAPGLGAEYPYPVLVDIKGVTQTARFARLADALTAAACLAW